MAKFNRTFWGHLGGIEGTCSHARANGRIKARILLMQRSVIVAREDRLFRDKHGQQSGTFTEAAEKYAVVVILPLIVANEMTLYDFSNYEHLKIFREKTKAAYDYIYYHIGYMHKNKQKKVDRGEYDGRGLPPGLTIKLKERGREQRPIIYEPWATVMQKFALRAKALDWNIAKLNKEAASTLFLFLVLFKGWVLIPLCWESGH